MAYILLNKRAGAQVRGGSALALAVTWAALVSAPFGVIETGTALVQPLVLLAGFGIAVVSAGIPYSLDLAALRRLSPRAFGLLGSLEPAAGAAAGFLILRESLTLVDCSPLPALSALRSPPPSPNSTRRPLGSLGRAVLSSSAT